MGYMIAFAAGAAVGAGSLLFLAIAAPPRNSQIEDTYEVAKASYTNGRETMRKAVIDKLQGAKAKALGAERSQLSEVIEMVEKIRV